MLGFIKNFPNRFNMFTQKGFTVYVLEDNTVHLMPEIPEALFKKGYILVIVGGGITGDIQINDTHCQRHLKGQYRDLEKFPFQLFLTMLKIALAAYTL